MGTIECKTCSGNTHIPKRAYQPSADYDLFAAETTVLKPWGRALIKLNLSMSIPEGYYEQNVGCFALANMCGIIVHDGMIDSDYRGVVCMVLFNLSIEEYMVETGIHTAQLIIERCIMPKFVESASLWMRKQSEAKKVLVLQVFNDVLSTLNFV